MKVVKLGRFEQFTFFDIWSPRYHDKVVLLKRKKVKEAKTTWLKIKFSKAPSLTEEYVISRTKALTFPKDSNGTADMLAVPLNELNILEINNNDVRGVM